jgi:gliding motility-associated-like protein
VKSVTLVALLMVSFSLFSQGEAANWFFGNGAGLTFDLNTETVTPTNLAASTINTNEGCSSISDSAGNLLFYTDGRNVWDKNHKIMPNANYNNRTGLFGDPSSTSSGLIIPRPGNLNNYYVFTVDEPHHNNAWAYPNQGPADSNGNSIDYYDNNSNGGSVPFDDDGYNNGLNYSLVDLTLNNGNGDVVRTEKNKPLLTYDPTINEQAAFKCSEKITAVEHSDGQSYWVVSHFIDSFYAFKVDNNGVNKTPVKTAIMPLISLNGYRRNAIGYLKSSPDGKKLAICHSENGRRQGQRDSNSGSLWIYDFDDATGLVSNPVNILANSPLYGVEFSIDSSKLYATINNRVSQFDLNAADVSASATTVFQGSNRVFALQLAPNGKIYVINFNSNSSLDVINTPNELGALCDYKVAGQPLSRGTSASLGLPPFIQSFFLAKIEINKLCFGDRTEFAVDSNETYTSIQWDFGDSTTSTLDNPSHVYATPGNFTVTATITLGTDIKTFSKSIVIAEVPTAYTPKNIRVCDDDNNGVVDINLNQTVDSDILKGQSPLTYSIRYFETPQNANTGTDALLMPYQNKTNPQTLYARIENSSNKDCFDTTSFTMTVFDTPVANTVNPGEVCDDASDGDGTNGRKITNLRDFDSNVLGGQDPLKFNISYHSSQGDADTKSNPHPDLYYNTSPVSEQVFVRIETILNDDCFDTTSFNLVINPLPKVRDLSLKQCDEDGVYDGLTIFNLTEIDASLINNVPNKATKFYTDLTSAQNSTGAIDGTAFNNTHNPQTVYVQLIDTLTNCFDIAKLTLNVTVTTGTNTTLMECDADGTEDGLYSFTLSDADASILSGLPSSYTLRYYETSQDALLEVDPLNLNYTNTTPYNQIIFARIENNNDCFGINQIELVVHKLPQITIEDDAIYCLNTYPASITLDPGLLSGSPSSFSYNWSTGATTPQIQVNKTGIYTVDVYTSNGCSKRRTLTVLPSNIAEFDAIEIVDGVANNTVTITVSGEGDYEYSLDDEFSGYQDSNVFTEVIPGLYTVYVRDKNDCGIAKKNLSVIGFPNFFSPNGDGFNDTWHVYGINTAKQVNSKVYIFDRYGKLLIQLNPLGNGWDGTIGGLKMPTSDYWFYVKLEDDRIFKGHFSLRR